MNLIEEHSKIKESPFQKQQHTEISIKFAIKCLERSLIALNADTRGICNQIAELHKQLLDLKNGK